MKIVLDESVSYGFGEVLRHEGHEVIAIAEAATAGNADEEVFKLACDTQAVLVTRDYHFTNHLRFPADKSGGIVYIRHGNLTSEEEVQLVANFLSKYSSVEYNGKLATLYRSSVKIR